MDDYCNGIAWATGYIVRENKKQYLVVRNSESWYVKCIAEETGYEMYRSEYHEKHRNTTQWIVKARNIDRLVELSEIQSVSDFCRAYIEIHGVLDLSKRVNNKKGLRLRIYGKENIIQFINKALPAKEKKVQYTQNKIEHKYIGKTCVIYYQSRDEIEDILRFLDGSPKNICVWNKWKQVVQSV